MIHSFVSACFKFIGISKNLAGRTEHGVIWFGFGLGLSSLSLSLHCWNIHIPHISSFLYRVDVKYTNHLTMQRKDVMQPLLSWERWIRHRTECQMSPGMTPVAILARMQSRIMVVTSTSYVQLLTHCQTTGFTILSREATRQLLTNCFPGGRRKYFIHVDYCHSYRQSLRIYLVR